MITDSSNYSCYTYYQLDTTIHWSVSVDSSTFLKPIVFTTADGRDLNDENSGFFPVFKDPTFGGMFPEMVSTQDWRDLLNVEEYNDTIVAVERIFHR